MPRVSHRRTPASFPAPGAHRDELLGWLQRELIRRNAGSSRLMGLMDDNRSGTASFNEFATGLCAVDVDLERDDYMRLFKAIDMNGDRMLSLREVAERLYATQYPPPRGDTWGGVRGGGSGGSPGIEEGGADEGPMRTGSEAEAIQNFRESVRRFPELLPGEASGLLGTTSLRMKSKPTVSTNRPLRRQRSRRIVYRNEARLKPIVSYPWEVTAWAAVRWLVARCLPCFVGCAWLCWGWHACAAGDCSDADDCVATGDRSDELYRVALLALAGASWRLLGPTIDKR